MSKELVVRLRLLAEQMPHDSLDGAAVSQAADTLERQRKLLEEVAEDYRTRMPDNFLHRLDAALQETGSDT